MNARRNDDSLPSALDADTLALHVHGSALANLAFGSMSRTAITGASQGRNLAFLPNDALELDLTDPVQRQFGDYELLELIGEGGMGVVYRARQASLDRDVAVKLLAAGPWASREFVERFHREAQNAARMQHPNIVAIYEVGSAEELHFFSMRLIQGSSLAAVVKRDGRLPAARAATLMRTIAEAVDYAHRLGVLHLDLKPANVLLDEDGNPHVADFGLARRLDDGLAADSDEVSGTPSYMAPEQATVGARRITAATDIWGLGAILYELVTAQPPFLGDSPHATLKLVVEGALRSPRRYVEDLPRDLEAIILKCMARDVAGRYASARALADDLARFIEGREVRAHPLNIAQRSWRWARREPKVAALAVLAFSALLAGIAATTQQWRRAETQRQSTEQQRQLAENNATTSNQRLWASRHDAALRLERDGKGFEALPQLIANIEEQERAGKNDLASVERREVSVVLNQGVILIDRMIIADANPITVALSPDGSLLAVGLNDVSVRWYDTATLTERGRVDLADLPTSDGTTRVPQLLRFVDNHRLRATLEWFSLSANPADNNTYLIDLDAARVIKPPAAFADFTNANYSADGRFALLYNRRSEVQFWQVKPWRPVSDHPDPNPIDPNLPWLLTQNGHLGLRFSNTNLELERFDPRQLSVSQPIQLPSHDVATAWRESGDGSQLALGDAYGSVFLIDLKTFAARQLPMPAGREITWLEFSEDSAWLGVADQDGAAYAFDVASGTALHSGQMQNDFIVSHVAVDRRRRLLIASGVGETTLWRLPKPGPNGMPATRLISGPTRSERSGQYWVSESPQTGLLATADMDGEVRLWRLPHSPMLPERSAQLVAAGLNFDGEHVPDVAYTKIRVASVHGGPATPWVDLPQPVGFAELVDGAKTLVASAGPQLFVFDAATMKPRYPPLALRANPMRLAASADGAFVVLAFGHNGKSGFEENLESYDLRTGKLRVGGATVKGPLRQLELSPDASRLLATGPPDGSTEIFDSATLQRLGAYPHDAQRPVLWATFTADATQVWLVTRNVDDTLSDNAELIRWDPRASVLRERRNVPGAYPIGVTLLGNKPLLATKDRLILDPGTHDERSSERRYGGEATTVFAVSHDGRLIAHAFGRDVQVYDATTLVPIAPALHTDMPAVDAVAQLAFSRDDQQLLCRTMQQEWLVWPVATDSRASSDLSADAGLLAPESGGQRIMRRADAAETRDLRRRDPGPGSAAESRPEPPVARMISGVPLPLRASDTSPLLLDLTAVYTAAPGTTNNIMNTVFPAGAGLPFGRPRIDGVDYDLRGAAELRSTGTVIGLHHDVHLQAKLTGIKVPALPIAAFHVLMHAPMLAQVSNEVTYADIRLHYRDGSEAILPLRTLHELPAFPGVDWSVPIGWVQGDAFRLIGGLFQRPISDPRLPNPHPDRLIASLDLETEGNSVTSLPVFFAITAEPVIPTPNSGSNTANNVTQEKP
ncbi:MAG TPA: WD40 repeat domain-containing serine/threonine-protein kinase [Rudaea sp.]|jgi:serine/threonine protein kinase|uniref:WD40 repeat domain-containing serine/threonine protein kinase n=1 Tax=Rudaea sp. TaxID=2136325 RepID=UPI002F935211